MATAADVRAFYGGPAPFTLRAYVALLDGKPVALGGISYRDGLVLAFMEIKDEMRPYKFSIGKFAAKLPELFGQGVPGMAIADPNEPTADRLLRWLGFKFIASCDDGEIYEWVGQQ